MIKVKAHSGDRLNDHADFLAKAAVVSAPRFNVNYMKILGLRLMIACDHLVIEKSSRKCIKQLHDAQHFHNYLQLQRNKEIKTLTK